MARNYQREYQIEPPVRRKERAQRNAARRIMTEKVGKAALFGKDVHHVNGHTVDRAPANLQAVMPASHNHGRKGGGGLKGGK